MNIYKEEILRLGYSLFIANLLNYLSASVINSGFLNKNLRLLANKFHVNMETYLFTKLPFALKTIIYSLLLAICPN